jgi:hypothetical protein
MVNQGKHWHQIEIGLSKGSCWLCEKFLLELQLHHRVQFLVSNFRGKLQAGWMWPPLCRDDAVRATVEKYVADELEEIVERTQNRRRSDSFPRTGSDGVSGRVWPGLQENGFVADYLSQAEK